MTRPLTTFADEKNPDTMLMVLEADGNLLLQSKLSPILRVGLRNESPIVPSSDNLRSPSNEHDTLQDAIEHVVQDLTEQVEEHGLTGEPGKVPHGEGHDTKPYNTHMDLVRADGGYTVEVNAFAGREQEFVRDELEQWDVPEDRPVEPPLLDTRRSLVDQIQHYRDADIRYQGAGQA